MPRRNRKKPESNWQIQIWIVVAIVAALWFLGIAGTSIQRLLIGSLQVPWAAPVTVPSGDSDPDLGSAIGEKRGEPASPTGGSFSSLRPDRIRR
jgi:hypothetical protein